LYFLPLKETAPLYRRCKMMSDGFIVPGQRTAYMTWKTHTGGFVRGGDAWKVERHRPELFAWASETMAREFDLAYVKDTLELSDAQLAQLIDVETKKYEH